MSSSTLPVLTPTIIQELLEKHREVLLSSLAKMLPAPASAPTSSAAPDTKGRKKKEKKPVDPDAPPKEKRAPNAWILFAMRVEKLVRAAEELAGKTTKETRMHTVVIKQFAASLKSQKAYDEWADDEITEAMTTWTPPEVSKQAAAKAEKEASVASDSASVASADVADAPAAEKPKRKWSEEAKAAAAAKRAAKRAEEAAAAPAPAADADASAVAPAPVKKAIAIKPKKAAPAPEPAKKVDLSFFAWTHDGTDYYTNDRGDVVTTDWEWVGRFNGSVIESVSEPSDLSEATLRD